MKDDPLGIEQEIEIWPYEQMVYAQHRIPPWKWASWILKYRRINESRNLITINKKKKRTCRIVDFAVPVDHRIKLKERERRISTTTLQGNWKKAWNVEVTVKAIAICALGTITKGLVQRVENLGIKGHVLTIQTTAFVVLGKHTEKNPGDLQSLKIYWLTIN